MRARHDLDLSTAALQGIYWHDRCMTMASPDLYAMLGFPAADQVATLKSVAHLFGASKKRCGIYLLEFPDERFYIGQAVDAVRRFGQHRINYDDICGFSFLPVVKERLNTVERDLIERAEREGLVILNTIHVSNVVGETDLDLILLPQEQDKWLESPEAFNAADLVSPIVLPIAQLERFARKFHRYGQHPLSAKANDLLARYVRHCLPAPRRTEYSFWSVSCLPSTNLNTWPRLFCLSAGVMELLVVGHHASQPDRMWGFVTVASDVLWSKFGSERKLLENFPFLELVQRDYRDAGQHQVTLFMSDHDMLCDVLGHAYVQQAASSLALRVMRKRATIYSKFHCKQLADLVV